MSVRIPFPICLALAAAIAGGLFFAWFRFGRSPVPTEPLVDAIGKMPRANGHSAAIAPTDPRADGWDSEVFAEEALGQLSVLADTMSSGEEITEKLLSELVTNEFQCSPLRPDGLRDVFSDGALVSRRYEGGALDPSAFTGARGLVAALGQLARPDLMSVHLSAHFKMVQVEFEASGDAVRSSVIGEIDGTHTGGRFEAHARWRCEWKLRDALPPLLGSIVLDDYQEVELAAEGGSGKWFSEASGAVLGGNPSFREQLAFGMQHWLGRIERVHLMLYFQRFGLAVGDVNGDGLDDLYLCQPGGLPNRLYVQQRDGTARDVSHEAGVDWLDHTASCLLVDLDNDGDQDLCLATVEGVYLLGNDGDGHFELRVSLPTADSDLQSLSAADYDNDGDLDLYVCADFARLSARPGESRPRFDYHDANDGGANLLFRNDLSRTASMATWNFTDVTESVGLDHHNRRHSLSAAWEDYDDDGDQDLYVANDYGLNNLFRNDEGTAPGSRSFVDVAAEAGVLDPGSGMSAEWIDYNGDGRMDLYVGNMFSSAGSRITRQERFRANGDPALRPTYERFAKGNSLFANAGDGSFRETGAAAGVELGRWAWSSISCDMNNDGWEDLFVANGYISTDDSGDL